MTSSATSSDSATDLWQFSCDLYAATGISRLVIMLQDRYGVDVNLLLYACWRAGRTPPLRPLEIEAMDSACAPLRDSTILPLRAARRELDKDQEAEKRRELLAAELEAERAELNLLHELTPPTSATGLAEIGENLATNLAICLKHYGIAEKEDARDAVTALIGAALTLHEARQTG